MMRTLGLAIVSFSVFAAVGCGDNVGTTPPVDAAAPTATAARGEYLVKAVGSCNDCHTPRKDDGSPDMTQFLSGVECFIDVNPGPGNDGCLHSRNLTNHPTGLMNRSDAEIKMMFQNGMRPNGQALIPVMPYWVFHNLTDVDAQSIVLYLRTVPGVDHTVPANDKEFPPPAQPAAPLDMNKIPTSTASTASARNGRYLASLACVECHTPLTSEVDFRAIEESKLLAGNRAFPRNLLGLPPEYPDVIYSANITPHATGLGSYTAAQIVAVLKQGVDKDGKGVCPPMPAGMAGFVNLTDQDANDIAGYLLSIPPVDNPVSGTCVVPTP